MGANVWRDEHEWPLKRTKWTKYFLHSNGRANSLLGDGTLSARKPQARQKPDRYTYDPIDPTPTLGGNHSVGPYNPGLYEMCLPGPQDQRPVERRDDVLVFTSDVLESDTEVTGPVVVRLFASSSCPDTDFVARLCDVHPNGLSINLCEGVIRARFREQKWDKPKLMEPGEIYEFTIELEPTSNVFLKGHRIRLQIASSNFPLWDRNPNTGGDPPTERHTRRAEQSIFHDASHPSHVMLPIIPR
jgi:putative CocE/NonD family hydrolase